MAIVCAPVTDVGNTTGLLPRILSVGRTSLSHYCTDVNEKKDDTGAFNVKIYGGESRKIGVSGGSQKLVAVFPPLRKPPNFAAADSHYAPLYNFVDYTQARMAAIKSIVLDTHSPEASFLVRVDDLQGNTLGSVKCQSGTTTPIVANGARDTDLTASGAYPKFGTGAGDLLVDVEFHPKRGIPVKYDSAFLTMARFLSTPPRGEEERLLWRKILKKRDIATAEFDTAATDKHHIVKPTDQTAIGGGGGGSGGGGGGGIGRKEGVPHQTITTTSATTTITTTTTIDSTGNASVATTSTAATTFPRRKQKEKRDKTATTGSTTIILCRSSNPPISQKGRIEPSMLLSSGINLYAGLQHRCPEWALTGTKELGGFPRHIFALSLRPPSEYIPPTAAVDNDDDGQGGDSSDEGTGEGFFDRAQLIRRITMWFQTEIIPLMDNGKKLAGSTSGALNVDSDNHHHRRRQQQQQQQQQLHTRGYSSSAKHVARLYLGSNASSMEIDQVVSSHVFSGGSGGGDDDGSSNSGGGVAATAAVAAAPFLKNNNARIVSERGGTTKDNLLLGRENVLFGSWGILVFGSNPHPARPADTITELTHWRSSGQLRAVFGGKISLPVMPLQNRLAVWPNGEPVTLLREGDEITRAIVRLDARMVSIASIGGMVDDRGCSEFQEMDRFTSPENPQPEQQEKELEHRQQPHYSDDKEKRRRRHHPHDNARHALTLVVYESTTGLVQSVKTLYLMFLFDDRYEKKFDNFVALDSADVTQRQLWNRSFFENGNLYLCVDTGNLKALENIDYSDTLKLATCVVSIVDPLVLLCSASLADKALVNNERERLLAYEQILGFMPYVKDTLQVPKNFASTCGFNVLGSLADIF